MTALAIRPEQTEWDEAQKTVLMAAGVTPRNPAEGQLFLAYCQRTGLDAITRQIYLVNGSVMVSIDGLRLIAERTGEYRGQTAPQWCGEDGVWRDVWISDEPPAAARVGVYRENYAEPTFGVAHWREFGSSRGTWSRMPALMLAKVAESHALRKSFPADMSGLYSGEEMGQAQPAAPPVPPRPQPEPEPKPTVDDDGVIVDAELLDPGEENE